MAYSRNPNSVIAGNAIKQNPLPSTTSPAGVLPVVLDAVIASKTELGVAQIGDNIDVTPEGIISVTFPDCECESKCKAISVDKDYTVKSDDFYIGVTSSKPVKILLPKDPKDCLHVVIKADMSPPLGNRKVTILAQGSNTIDDATLVVLTVPYESVTLISQGGNWHKI